MRKRLSFLSFEVRWWYWVALSIAWLMLCVWVRLEIVGLGRSMNQELARHNELLARVQSGERALNEVRQMENMEKRSAALGFMKMSAGSLVIVPPETSGGFISRLLGGKKQPPREEAVAAPEPAAAKPVRKIKKPTTFRTKTRKKQ